MPGPHRDGFARVPHWLVDADVPNASLRLYCILQRFRNAKTGRCNPSLRKIAETAGRSTNWVRKYLTPLEDIKAVLVTDRDGRTSEYTMPDNNPNPATYSGAPPEVADTHSGAPPATYSGAHPATIGGTEQEERNKKGEQEGSPLSNLSGESEPITAEAIEKRLGLPGGGWKVIRQWFARDCTFDRWIEFQHAETNPEALEALLADWSKRDSADRSRPAPNGLRVQLEAGPLRYYRDELRRQAHHARQRQAEREADEAAKRRNGGGHLPAEARRALRAQLGFLAAEDAEGEAETPRREHRPSEQGLTPVAI